MLRYTESKNFIAEPSYFKHMLTLARKESNSFITMEQNEIDELIELLIRTKEEFNK